MSRITFRTAAEAAAFVSATQPGTTRTGAIERRTGEAGARSFVRLLTGPDSRDRHAALADLIAESRPPGPVVVEVDAASLTFRHPALASLPSGALLVILEAERAFPRHQTNGTRLVLTSATYVLPVWLEQLRGNAAWGLVLDANHDVLGRGAPEALEGRGTWASSQWLHTQAREPVVSRIEPISAVSAVHTDRPQRLARAFAASEPAARFAACRALADEASGDAVVQLALASACMELTALDAAHDALLAAAAAAPDWGAVDFEFGKLWLRAEELDRAIDAFGQAAARLPWFAPALLNLGAALGERLRPEEAMDAFRRALQLEPTNIQAVNNVGVTARDLGRLDEAVAAFRQVVTMSPSFVFGHYNLGHALFLQGRFRDAVDAYAAGRARDPEANAVQTARLGFARIAAGDAAAGLRDVRDALGRLDGERLDQLVQEGLEVETALRPLLPAAPGLAELRTLLLTGPEANLLYPTPLDPTLGSGG